MSIEAPHTTGLFAELLEGANALAQRPTLIAEKDQAIAEAKAAHDRAESFANRLWQREAEISDLKAKLEEKEAALAQATFQHSELGSKLSLVASVLKDVMGNATAAMELVEPPKPEPELVIGEPVTVEGVKTYDPDPTPSTEASQSSDTNLGSTTTNSEKQVGGPVDLPGTFIHSEGFIETKVGEHSIIEPTRGEPFVTSPEDQSASGPTASSMDAPSAVAAPATGSSSADTPAVNSTAASLPKPYWEKPKDEEWFSWAKAGNDVAPWVTFNWDENDALKRAYAMKRA
jgi:hypothetical protein